VVAHDRVLPREPHLARDLHGPVVGLPSTRMRRAALLAGLLLFVATSPVAAGAVGQPGPVPPSRMLVPAGLPAEWFVYGATAPPAAPDFDGGFAFYTSAAGAGRALAVGLIGGEDGFDALRDPTPEEVPRLTGGTGTLRRNGRWVWVTWPGDGEDVVNLVAARNLTDAEVVAAARAAAVPNGGTPSIPARALPLGMKKLVTAPVFPYGPHPTEHITLVNATGKRHVELLAYTASRRVRELQEFWARQSGLLQPAGPRSPLSVLGPQRDVVVLARGDAPARELARLAASMAQTDESGWQTFRARVALLPLAAMLPNAAPPGTVVIDGSSGSTRWVVEFGSAGGLPESFDTIVTPDGTNGGGGSFGVPPEGGPDVLAAGGSSANGGRLMAGVIPAAAARAQFEPDGSPSVDVVLGPIGPDDAHRYFAAWVDGVIGYVPLVVYDRDGNVIARQQQFGCNVCQ
jgi:hypothetical protein